MKFHFKFIFSVAFIFLLLQILKNYTSPKKLEINSFKRENKMNVLIISLSKNCQKFPKTIEFEKVQFIFHCPSYDKMSLQRFPEFNAYKSLFDFNIYHNQNDYSFAEFREDIVISQIIYNTIREIEIKNYSFFNNTKIRRILFDVFI